VRSLAPEEEKLMKGAGIALVAGVLALPPHPKTLPDGHQDRLPAATSTATVTIDVR
jgi:hypothetical protein